MAGSVALPKGFKTWVAKPSDVKQNWYVVDATDKSLGRLSSLIAMRLMGKDKPTYTAHIDTGDFVVVLNAEKISVDDKKRTSKIYRHHSGYLGGLKKQTFNQFQVKHPDQIIIQAVRKMLPKNLLGRHMVTKLKVFKGDQHPHQAQKPAAWAPLG